MKFKIDENLPVDLVQLLQSQGFDAMSVEEQGLAGEPDNILFPICQHEDRVLITFDVEFGNIRIYPPESHVGVIVLRLKSQDKFTVISVFQAVIPRLMTLETMRGQLWIVDEQSIRIRNG